MNPLRSRIRPGDLVGEAVAALLARPTRMLLTAAGTMLGVGALVAVSGLTTTAGSQIVSRFDVLAATEVVVTPADELAAGGASQLPNVIPWDAERRVAPVSGIVAAGTLTRISVDLPVRTVPVVDPAAAEDDRFSLAGASPGTFAAVDARIAEGRAFDAGHARRGDAVVVLGRAAAQRLGVESIDRQPALFVGDVALSVIGILDDVRREPALLDALIVPDALLRDRFDVETPGEVRIKTALGAARSVGSLVPLALAPQAPERLAVRVPPEPEEVRATVADDLRALFLLLGALSLIAGGLGIANTTLVGVLERTSEIGLRRSLGAYRSHVAAQFLLESTTVGTLGGTVGTSVGVLVVVAASAAKSWTPVLEPAVPLLGVAAGAFIGLVAGTYPAWRAANVEPITALRAEV